MNVLTHDVFGTLVLCEYDLVSHCPIEEVLYHSQLYHRYTDNIQVFSSEGGMHNHQVVEMLMRGRAPALVDKKKPKNITFACSVDMYHHRRVN